jgi:hypothetical protein
VSGRVAEADSGAAVSHWLGAPSDPPRSADSPPVKIDSLPIDLQVSAAVARKAQSVQKQLGQAAVQLIEGAGAAAPAPTADGRGQLVNTKA